LLTAVRKIQRMPRIPSTPWKNVTEKIQRVARKFTARDVKFQRESQSEGCSNYRMGLWKIAVCIAKTQYTLSDDPKRDSALQTDDAHGHKNARSLPEGSRIRRGLGDFRQLMLIAGLPKFLPRLLHRRGRSGAIIGV